MKEPHSEEAERAVLGAILCDAEAMARVRPHLAPEDFHHSHHVEIYRAMVALHDRKSVVDLVTMSDYLKENGRVGSIGGAAYLCELADASFSAVNIKHYVGIVKKKAQLRNIIDESRRIATQASQPGANPDEIPTRLSIEISHDAEINQVSAAIHNLNQNIEKGYPGLPPCYDLLARTIRKVSPGHLWVAGGYTSTGKTALLVDFICRMYRHGLDNPGIAVFSTEMSCEQYLLRMLSNHTGIPTWSITENKMYPDQAEKLVKAQIFFSKRNLYLYDRLYKIEDIERTARMLKERGLDIIAIDYLQNMWGDGNIYERMSRLAPVLQSLAKDLQITIIALSQVSNQFQRDRGLSGGVFGFKGAGEIAASADLGIELERDPQNKERMIFKVSKNRHGRTSEGVLQYVNGFTRLEEVAEGDEKNGG